MLVVANNINEGRPEGKEERTACLCLTPVTVLVFREVPKDAMRVCVQIVCDIAHASDHWRIFDTENGARRCIRCNRRTDHEAARSVVVYDVQCSNGIRVVANCASHSPVRRDAKLKVCIDSALRQHPIRQPWLRRLKNGGRQNAENEKKFYMESERLSSHALASPPKKKFLVANRREMTRETQRNKPRGSNSTHWRDIDDANFGIGSSAKHDEVGPRSWSRSPKKFFRCQSMGNDERNSLIQTAWSKLTALTRYRLQTHDNQVPNMTSSEPDPQGRGHRKNFFDGDVI
jgi:hypothetical protein